MQDSSSKNEDPLSDALEAIKKENQYLRDSLQEARKSTTHTAHSKS